MVVDDVASKVEAIWKSRFFIFVANQRKWASHHRNYVVWAFFQLNGEEVGGIIDPKVLQMMQCMLCHHVTSSSSSHKHKLHNTLQKGPSTIYLNPWNNLNKEAH